MFKARNIVVFLPLIIFMIVAVFLWRGLKGDPDQIPSPFINKPVPEFKAYSLFNSQQLITNADLKGKVILLNVFATWCISCQAEQPVLMDIKDSKKVILVGLDYKDQRAQTLQWLTKEGNPYQQIIDDPQGNVGINLGVYGTPETFVIDAQGIVRDKFVGAISPDDWKDKLLPEVLKLTKEST